MQVLCLGFPRTSTESLANALHILGYDHVYHGFDIVFDDPCPAPAWLKLLRKKFYGTGGNGGGSEGYITAEEFDTVLGDSEDVTDSPGTVFAAELIAAYPDAKVVLNYRDEDTWYESIEKTFVAISKKWWMTPMMWFHPRMFWAMHLPGTYWVSHLFQARGRPFADTFHQTGKWVFRQHYAMVRGLVPAERLLEWKVQDGWEPLCSFLGKEIPNEPLPHVNAASGGWKERENSALKAWAMGTFLNMGIFSAVGVGLSAWAYRCFR